MRCKNEAKLPENQPKPALVYIPLLCFEWQRRFRQDFKALKYKLYSSCSGRKYSRISDIRAEGGERQYKSNAKPHLFELC